ncbi:MAG: ABC transporter ATP-binding protein [Bacteroidales bacterium]|nr:MAG: ABC transporter ATP-binding protein [Bacteroidales bacterium]
MTNSMITIRGLKKSYSSNEVLKGIDIDITPGQIIGYIGPNGAGKSTTVKILCGIITEYEGDIKVFDMDLRTQSLEIKKRIGYVPENGALYDLLTPREYLSFIGTIYGISKDKLDTRINHLLSFFGMDKNSDQRMDTFSKGMKQKILIMAGIINNPDILFLDEPLSGLDANSVILVKEMLISMASEGKTIFFCSHLMDVVEKISDRIILINDGKVLADGTFDELKTEKSATLEKLFANLTGNKDSEFKSEVFNKAFEE